MESPHQPIAPDLLSKAPYGEGLAEWIWDEFSKLKPGAGIYHAHPYYCGIGLIRTAGGAALHYIEDGLPFGSPCIGWSDREFFLSYWAGQSDYGLCGADPEYPEILAANDFELNNQRIDLAEIHAFLNRNVPSGG